MPRIHRLALLLTLSALPTLSTAQMPNTQTAALTKDTILFDFEAGNFDGWTLTGDCWDKAPATPKTFVDRANASKYFDLCISSAKGVNEPFLIFGCWLTDFNWIFEMEKGIYLIIETCCYSLN